MSRPNLIAALAVGIYIFLPAPALPQMNTGRISGTVTDTSGGVVPGAAVSVVNQDTHLESKAATDNSGYYLVVNLPVGAYSVTVEAKGFRKAEQTGIALDNAARVTADFKLEVGALSESVVVSEVVGETVNTVSGEIRHTIDSEQVQDLALNGRNYIELITLIPGVAVTSLDQMTMTTGLSVSNQSINGNRSDTNHMSVDGASNLVSGSNTSQINNVGVDFIQQVSVQTSSFSAEYGRNSGSNINVVTKSGTAQFHGSLFETIRNDALDANAYFAAVKPALRFNDYGWSIGGPVAFGPLKKGKLFFFEGEEWKKIRKTTNPSRQTIPTLAEMNGDFSDRSTTVYYPGTKTPIPNKIVPSSLITPDGKAIMNVYLAMSKLASVYSNTPTGNNATYQMPNPFNYREDIFRIDWHPNERHGFYFRYIHDAYNIIDPFSTFAGSPLPTDPTLRSRPGWDPQLGWIFTITPTLLNEARFNIAFNGQKITMYGDTWQRNQYGFQFPLIYGGIGEYPTGIPNVAVTGFASFYGPYNSYQKSGPTNLAYVDNLTWIHGSHMFKFGGTAVRDRLDQNGQAPYLGNIAINNTSANTMTTGSALADTIMGQYYTYTEAQYDPWGRFRYSLFDGYAQDSYKVARNLSLEIGVRFSHYIPTYTTANNMANFVPSLYNPLTAVSITAGGLIVPGSGNAYDGLIRAGNGVPPSEAGRVPNANSQAVLAVPTGAPRGLYNVQEQFMPRFGFAWKPNFRHEVAVRGGFGTFHDRPEGNLIIPQTTVPPYSVSSQYTSGNLSNPGGGAIAAPAPLGTIHGIDPNLKTPVMYTYNLGIQTELAGGFFLDVTYAGNQGRHLIRAPNINFPSFATLAANYALPSSQQLVLNAMVPYKGYSTINEYLSDSNSNYNALQVHLTKRKGNIVMTANYTWSKALSDSSGNYSSGEDAVEFLNRSYNYGPTSFDRRHLFVSTYTYRMPFLRNRHGLVGGAFACWELSGIVRFQTGPYLTPTGSATGVTRRSSYDGQPVTISDPGPNQWFNTVAFANAPVAALGNAGVGVIEGPDWVQCDISLRKVFKIREGWTLRLTADAINAPNHTNFDSPNVSTSGGSAYGTISSAEPPRNLQFGIRIAF
jgi:hypothetical protein